MTERDDVGADTGMFRAFVERGKQERAEEEKRRLGTAVLVAVVILAIAALTLWLVLA